MQHCVVDNWSNNKYLIYKVEEVYLDGLGRKRKDFKEHFKVKSAVVHPDYSIIKGNDIAILVLDGHSAVEPVQLSNKTPADGEVITAVGWGQIEGNKHPKQLMTTKLMVDADCSTPSWKIFHGDKSLICAASIPVGPGKNTSTCPGDSGK